ncbi:MAG: hypothetical protein DRP93_02445 [Candidatus Neomarinimicrobiota bacterium]|nr:MAG: hypothetical protein DRP93_02445 [Candidatus Neomarinimicrobiota bacterium]
MTYAKLKSAIKLLLIGDNELPSDNDQILAAIEMAYIQLASKATALKLLTTNNSSEVIRQGPGGTYVRMPELPELDTDELDIDRELCPALARIIASYVSREKGAIHNSEAQKILTSYESKVRVFLEEKESEGVFNDPEMYPETYASARVKGY